MPSQKDKPIYPQILELPLNLTPAQFQTLVGDRIRDLNLLLRGVGLNPSVTDLSLGSFRITNVADPTDDLDGVNLRTLKRLASQAPSPAPVVAVAPVPVVPGSTNGAGSGGGVPLGPGGVPTSGTPIPPGVPHVSVLPGPSDPLSVIGQQIIYNGAPYVFKAGLVSGGYWSIDVTGSPAIRDTFANLSLYNPFDYAVGTVFFATDWLVSYAVQNTDIGLQWVYYNGVYQDVIANIPTTLSARDLYFTFRASDYFHSWVWDGAGFHLTTGGFPPGYIIQALSPLYLPFGALWHALDGTTQPISQDDGTLLNEVLGTAAGSYIAQ